IFTIAVLIVIYIFSEPSTESSTSSDSMNNNQIVEHTGIDSAARNNTNNKSTVENKDELEEEQVTSPFITKERKSAFERNSRLGVYGESEDEKYFTYGDTAGRVFEIQGVPTKTKGDIWYYGNSEVHFQEGRVKSWYVAEGNRLKAKAKKPAE
ncbi:MAG: hypothetical protein PVG20_06210, partial [Thioalkalispiraceae bacterium]